MTIFRLFGNEIPTYVSNNVSDNRRRYTTNFQQRSSAVFTATYDVEGTYDAYEKDIAIVSFFFEYPTVFEFTRQVGQFVLRRKQLMTYCKFPGRQE